MYDRLLFSLKQRGLNTDATLWMNVEGTILPKRQKEMEERKEGGEK